jgi:hypothetical protein
MLHQSRKEAMPNSTNKLIDSFVSKLMAVGILLREENNASRFQQFEAMLPKKLPQSFASFLSRYSFRAFDAEGISFFDWNSDSNAFAREASAPKGSLSELLLPAGYVQIGQPGTGSFDAVCFDLNVSAQNREYPIVQADHEEILCNWRVKISKELWPSFIKFADNVVSSTNPQVAYQDPEI